MELCRRNMIPDENNQSICLLDWAHAGRFPRFFEVATISCLNPVDAQYQKPLLQAVEELLSLTEEERHLVKLMKSARAASLRLISIKLCSTPINLIIILQIEALY